MPTYTSDENGEPIRVPAGVNFSQFLESIEQKREAIEHANRRRQKWIEEKREELLYQQMVQEKKLQIAKEAQAIFFLDVRLSIFVGIIIAILYFKHFHSGAVIAACKHAHLTACGGGDYDSWYLGITTFLNNGVDSRMSVYLFVAPLLGAVLLLLKFRISAAMLWLSVGGFATYLVSGEFHFWLSFGAVIGPALIVLLCLAAILSVIFQIVMGAVGGIVKRIVDLFK
jgi:hypothetical protein